ncbi:retroviral-like aspartic protease family protein [Muricauda ruestringensis]|uniref:retropepsin-like aspartic protease n=1 Tax=Flagellimonas ruestringensis TaxID=111501 RepID=UPI001CD764F0|nr:retropepsin-like aspartic protease [Allomuricauda ruestringensis]MCA0958215.1 retroviral-like aspartic protease family protein [Allomuricauda ruestringensis]
MTSLKKFLRSKDYIKIPLTFTQTDHFELTASINGVSGKFILDTGASNTCVGMDKIEFFEMISEATDIKAAGAGATEMETLISSSNKIQIGEWTKKKQKVVVFDLSHVNHALLAHNALPVDGIIGADILKKGKAIIDYNKKCLYLKK